MKNFGEGSNIYKLPNKISTHTASKTGQVGHPLHDRVALGCFQLGSKIKHH